MRLICPNCDAQYEVPTNIIPLDGRDVQCSNCGYTWFQSHPDAPPEARAPAPQEDEEIVTGSPDTTPYVTDEVPETADPETDDTTAPAMSASAVEPPPAPDLSEQDEPAEPEPEPEPADAPLPARRELDPAVANVLRAEAELEEQARRNEMTGLESQPELGLQDTVDDAERRAEQARTRMARMRGQPERPPAPETKTAAERSHGSAPTPSRRDLLPDIEEINSTLRSNSDRSPASDSGQTAQLEQREKRSSRRGFSLAVMLVALLVLIYAFAPQMGETLPQAQEPLAAYVAAVDTGRAWLDGKVEQLLGWLDQAAQSRGE